MAEVAGSIPVIRSLLFFLFLLIVFFSLNWNSYLLAKETENNFISKINNHLKNSKSKHLRSLSHLIASRRKIRNMHLPQEIINDVYLIADMKQEYKKSLKDNKSKNLQ